MRGRRESPDKRTADEISAYITQYTMVRRKFRDLYLAGSPLTPTAASDNGAGFSKAARLTNGTNAGCASGAVQPPVLRGL